ncbi:hypothetical protein BDR07DRAFT_1494014 [Suillus spraguei]|nr:hypothetical protein BDR07DRAFT_1494014 [Suillus spraguei]
MKVKLKRSKKLEKDSKQPSSETQLSQDDNVSQILGAAISAINATKELVPIDLAKGILGTVANILTIAQLVIKNKDILESATKGATEDDLQGYLGRALSRLNKSVSRINSDVESSNEHGFLRRLFSVAIDRDRIDTWDKDLDKALMLFRTEAITGIAIRGGQASFWDPRA